MKKQTHLIVVIIILVLMAGTLAELTPYFQGLIAGDLSTQTESNLVLFGLLFTGCLFLDALARSLLGIVTNSFGYNSAKHIRTKFFSEVINKPYTFFTSRQNGDLVYRTNTFIYDIGKYLATNVNDITLGVARFLVIFVFMFVLNVKLSLVVTGIFLFTLILSVVISVYAQKVGKNFRNLELHRSSLIFQNVENLETYLAYNDEFNYLKNYERVNYEYGIAKRKYYKIKHLVVPLVDFLASIATVVIYVFTFSKGLGIIEVGVLVAMLTYVTRIVAPIELIADGVSNAIHIHTTTDKILKYLHPTKEPQKAHLKTDKVDIVCQNVGYENMSAGIKFSGVNQKFKFKSKTAIIGGYGSGKTDFAEILLGLKNANEGEVLFNGIDVQNIDKTDLKNAISFVSENVGIFNGSLKSNILFAKGDATKKEFENAIKFSGLSEYVDNLVNKEHTTINSTNLAPEVKLQIAFARVILLDPKVVIFDEIDRNLSDEFKEKFFENVEKFTKNKTLIYISQTPPKTLTFDQVFRLANTPVGITPNF